MEGNSGERTTPKVRACSTCARLKMKCQWPASGSGRAESACMRCTRMKLPCQVPEPTQRKKRGKSTRVAQLEKKIDGIVSLLAANHHIRVTGPSPLTPDSPEFQIQQQLAEENDRNCEGDTCADDAVPTDVAGDFSHFELLPSFRVTYDEAQRYLVLYQQEYLPKYPFVPLPAGIAPHQLYSESRLLFWSILAVVVPLSHEAQLGFKIWFRKHLAEHLIVRQEKKLEYLQAILVHLGWNDLHFYLEMQATTLIQLAMALVIDLKLDRPPGFVGITPKTLIGDAWNTLNKGGPSRTFIRTTHTLAEQRAVLGFHHISCLISTLFRRGAQLSWNSYLARCCESLREAAEYESDVYLAAVVTMQNMTDRIYSLMPSFSFEHHDHTPSVFRAPLDMAIGGVRRELEALMKAQPETMKQNKYFSAYFHTFLMRLYEPIISMKAPELSDPNTTPTEPFQRSEALWKCLQSCSDFFTCQLTISPLDLATLPFTSTAMLAFAIVTTSRLIILDAFTDWDAALARKKLDFAELMRRLGEQFEEADQVVGRRRRLLDDGTSVYLKYSSRMRWIRQWYLSRIPAEEQPVVTTGDLDGTGDGEDLGMGQWTDGQMDDTFWQELMSFEIFDFPMPNAPVQNGVYPT